MPTPPDRQLIVGLGHPRCGTGFTASLLASSGLDVRHERPGRDGVVSWMAAAEMTETPYGRGLGSLEGHRVFCAVRSPLKAISSIIPENRKPRSFGWRATVIWERKRESICTLPRTDFDHVVLAVASYVNWFEMCLDLRPEVLFRIDRPEDDQKLSEFVSRDVRRSPEVRSNSRPHIRYEGFEPQMVSAAGPDLVERLAKLADRFGYPEDAETIRSHLQNETTPTRTRRKAKASLSEA